MWLPLPVSDLPPHFSPLGLKLAGNPPQLAHLPAPRPSSALSRSTAGAGSQSHPRVGTTTRPSPLGLASFLAYNGLGELTKPTSLQLYLGCAAIMMLGGPRGIVAASNFASILSNYMPPRPGGPEVRRGRIHTWCHSALHCVYLRVC